MKDLPENIIIPVYYGKEDNGDIIIDEDSIREEFELELSKLIK